MEKKSRIVIAHGDADFRMLLSKVLSFEDDMECVATTATSDETIAKVKGLDPDVLIMGLGLPRLDTMDVLKRLKTLDVRTKTVIVTPNYHSELTKQCQALGASYFVSEPCDLDLLMTRIRQAKDDSREEPKKALASVSLEGKISDILISLGVPAHIKGYKYVRDAILLTVQDMDMINSVTKRLYPAVAKRNNSTPSRVERAIRHAIETAWSRGDIDTLQKYFGCTVSKSRGKPTNSEFIAMIADRITLDLKGR